MRHLLYVHKHLNGRICRLGTSGNFGAQKSKLNRKNGPKTGIQWKLDFVIHSDNYKNI